MINFNITTMAGIKDLLNFISGSYSFFTFINIGGLIVTAFLLTPHIANVYINFFADREEKESKEIILFNQGIKFTALAFGLVFFLFYMCITEFFYKDFYKETFITIFSTQITVYNILNYTSWIFILLIVIDLFVPTKQNKIVKNIEKAISAILLIIFISYPSFIKTIDYKASTTIYNDKNPTELVTKEFFDISNAKKFNNYVEQQVFVRINNIFEKYPTASVNERDIYRKEINNLTSSFEKDSNTNGYTFNAEKLTFDEYGFLFDLAYRNVKSLKDKVNISEALIKAKTISNNEDKNPSSEIEKIIKK